MTNNPTKQVRLEKRAQKDLLRVPKYIVEKLKSWVDAVEVSGLEEVRKIPGYHDESLMGSRKDQRSIRLSRSYRAIYVIRVEKGTKYASVEEVTKHDY